ncbi:MAG: polyisoprenyl-phosphate glycosyltransferase [Solirubrobacterales bacterium]|jgi:dolichol-phosphate mannosyltransferase|nr:polyisoprenyl-phosphate glycosyltransferase [Solirubrobacterales bacterium]
MIAPMPEGTVEPGAGARTLGLLSVVAPLFNEEQTVAEFHRRATEALSEIPFELILVDDGSSDGTSSVLASLAADDERTRVITLSRNFGHQAAITAGLDSARGDAAVTMDGDLQDPPELIPEMLGRWRAGADVVSGVREWRSGETRVKLATARWFYRLFGRIAQIDLQPEAGDFRLLDRSALEALLGMRERNRFLRGMSVWVGFDQDSVPYTRDARHAGETKFTLSRMIRFGVDAISSFSYRPLQAATVLGFTFSLVAFFAIPVAIAFKIAGQFVPGVTTLLLVVLLLGGIQLITVGIIGEYLGRVYEEVKQRPLYVVRGRLNAQPPREGIADDARERG